MNAQALMFPGVAGGQKQTSQVRVWDTHWGFSISEKLEGRYDPAALTEFVTKLLGMVMLPACGIVLFLPEVVSGAGQTIVQAAMMIAFVLVGFALYRHADKGFRTKIQIDSSNREIRLGTQNAKGRFHLTHTYPVDDVESVFIARSKDTRTKAALKMRVKSGGQTLKLVEGSEAALTPILERVVLSLRPPQMRNRKVVTKATGGFIRMSFS